MLTTRNILYPKADPSEDRLSIIHKEFLTGFIRFSELDESLLKVFGNETGWGGGGVGNSYFSTGSQDMGKNCHHFQQQLQKSMLVKRCDSYSLVWKIVLIVSARLNNYFGI